MTSVDAPQRTGTPVRPDRPRPVARMTINLVVAAAFLWAGLTVDVDLGQLVEAPATFVRILGLMFLPPDLGDLVPSLAAMQESVQIAWIGTLIGALFSLPLGFVAAKNVGDRVTSNTVRQVLNGIRAVPELVLAIALIPLAGLGPFSGTLAIGIHSIGTLGKLTSEVIEGIDAGPLEAATATGASRLASMRWGVLPQVMPEVIAFWLYRFEINIRASAILGVVGAGGIGGLLSDFVTYRRWDRAGTAIIVVIGVTILIDLISGAIRRRIIAGPQGDVDPGSDVDLGVHGPTPDGSDERRDPRGVLPE